MFARRREELDRQADRIGALAVRGDVTLPQDLERAVAKTIEAFGGLDILVWNHGGPPPGGATDVTADSVEQAIELMVQPLVRLLPSSARTSRPRRAAGSSRSPRSPRRSPRVISPSPTCSGRRSTGT